ncbi:MAG: ABC transporter permease [Dehalococcoidia bacterium]
MATAPTVDIGLADIQWQRERSAVRAAPAAVLRFARRKPLGAVGGAIIVVMLLAGVFAPLIAPYGYDERDYAAVLQSPSSAHLLGTDDVGRDIFSRIVYGARVSMIVSVGAVLLSKILAAVIGIVAGYYGGKVDLVIQRLVDIWIAFPAILLLIVFAAVFGTPTQPTDILPGPLSLTLEPSEVRMAQIILSMGLILTAGSSRVIRGAVIAIRHNQYMESARALGAPTPRILLRYVLPNVAPTILVIATVQLGTAILIESTISFLGFGIPPPIPTWGQMLSGNATRFINRAPLLAVWPGLAISLAVFGFNMLGDALRDVLDPRLRGSR